MNEIYWITRLDGITIVLAFTLAICLVALFVTSVSGDGEDVEKCVKRIAIPVAISILGLIFIPSKKDMLLILGLGGTIEYIKSNDKTQELPDKVVDALNTLLENYINDQHNK